MTVPRRFQDLSQQYRFYWLHFPITLSPLQNLPFSKLQLAVEFNPGVAEGHLRPRTQMILPDRKFQELLTMTDSLDLRIGEDFEFEASTEALDGEVSGVAKGKFKGAVEAKAAGKLGVAACPFTYRLKKALVEQSGVGTEKVIWRLSDSESLQENDATFIVVLQIPKSVKEVQIAAALKAYHQPNFAAMGVAQAISYFSQRVAAFFRAGAPISDQQVWDITPSL